MTLKTFQGANMSASAAECFSILRSICAVPPIIRESSSEVTTHVGQDALLPCEVEEETHAVVTWRKDGFPITQDYK